MKKYLLSGLFLLASITAALCQFPLTTYIEQSTTVNPIGNHGHLYTSWKYNTEQIGFLGYGSNNGVLYMSNNIGDVNLSSTTATGNIRFSTNNSQAMRISPEGRVSIGRENPRYTLDVEGPIGAKNSLWLKTNGINSTEIVFEKQDQSYYNVAGNNTGFFIYNHSTQKTFFNADVNDNVGIGTSDTKGHKLAVSGSVLATKIKVQQTPWPDYVFEPAYKLPSLAELEAFVQKHKHLPGVPSAKEVAENGLDLGSTQAALLEKIEELTLIIIEQNKKLDAQEKRLQTIEKKLP